MEYKIEECPNCKKQIEITLTYNWTHPEFSVFCTNCDAVILRKERKDEEPIVKIDRAGELWIGEYNMTLIQQGEDYLVSLKNGNETILVPYDIYFKKFRELLKQLSKKFKVEENNGQVNEPTG